MTLYLVEATTSFSKHIYYSPPCGRRQGQEQKFKETATKLLALSFRRTGNVGKVITSGDTLFFHAHGAEGVIAQDNEHGLRGPLDATVPLKTIS